MSIKYNRMLLLGSVSLLPAIGYAQSAPTPAATPVVARGQLEEVVVTAQKRKENVQKVAISMTAISGHDLIEKSVKTLADLQFASPSLSVENSGLTQSVNIRGIGLSSGSPNAANGVATYLDGVFQPPTVSDGSYYDISDIEVLRGPQGTFVGSNATGGAVFLNTLSPEIGQFNGYAQVGAGTYGGLGEQGAVNIPLGNQFALRVALYEQKRNAYGGNIGPISNQAGRSQEFDSRVGLRYKPNAQYQATFKVETIQKETGGYAVQPVAGTAYYGLAPVFSNVYDTAYNSPTADNERAVQGSLEQHYTLNDGITFKSITGYENRQIHNLYDTDATAIVPLTEDQFVREKVYTEEVNVLSPTDGPLSWITGAYFQRNRIDVQIEEPPTPVNILVQNKKTTLGIFGQVAYKLTSDLTITGGVRYSHYEVFGSGGVFIGQGIDNGADVANTGGHEEDGAPTGKIDLDWSFAPNNMIYVFAARGYKSGGIQTPTTNFQKETVWDYETGWKSTSLDGHLKTQLDGFYNSYNNFQYDTVNTLTGQGSVGNVPTATIDGVEASAQARFNEWRFDGSMAYVHSELGNYTVIDQLLLPAGTLNPGCAPGVPSSATCTQYAGATKNVSGASNVDSPDFTFNGGAQYTFTTGDTSSLTPRVNYAYQTKQIAAASQDPVYTLNAHGLLSALLTYDYDQWTVQASATNLTGEKYVTGFLAGGSNVAAYHGAPREFNVTVRRDF